MMAVVAVTLTAQRHVGGNGMDRKRTAACQNRDIVSWECGGCKQYFIKLDKVD